MCLVARHRDALRKVFINHRCNAQGVYGLMICKDGEWVDVIVDDQFPVNKRGELLFSKVVFY